MKPKQKTKPWPDEGPCVCCKCEISGKHFHMKEWNPRAKEQKKAYGPLCSWKCAAKFASSKAR